MNFTIIQYQNEGDKMNVDQLEFTSQYIYYTFIWTISVFMGVVNGICIIVFNDRRFKTVLFQYLVFNSIIDSLYLILLGFLPLINCYEACSWERTYRRHLINTVFCQFRSLVEGCKCYFDINYPVL